MNTNAMYKVAIFLRFLEVYIQIFRAFCGVGVSPTVAAAPYRRIPVFSARPGRGKEGFNPQFGRPVPAAT